VTPHFVVAMIAEHEDIGLIARARDDFRDQLVDGAKCFVVLGALRVMSVRGAVAAGEADHGDVRANSAVDRGQVGQCLGFAAQVPLPESGAIQRRPIGLEIARADRHHFATGPCQAIQKIVALARRMVEISAQCEQGRFIVAREESAQAQIGQLIATRTDRKRHAASGERVQRWHHAGVTRHALAQRIDEHDRQLSTLAGFRARHVTRA
jgi:hypothetical protein